MIRASRPAENGEWKGCDSVLQIGNILGHNGVRREFHSKSSKMSLWWSAAKHFLNYNEASDSVLQISHLLRSNVVQREFHTNSYKVSLRR